MFYLKDKSRTLGENGYFRAILAFYTIKIGLATIIGYILGPFGTKAPMDNGTQARRHNSFFHLAIFLENSLLEAILWLI